MKQQEAILTDAYSDDDHALIARAYAFAKHAHEGQNRESGTRYITHPVAVAEILVQLNLDAETIAAGLLHDVLEDSSATKKELEKEFGENVAFLVSAVTKLHEVDFSGEKELAENFRKMILATAQDIRVVLIKLADVLHNAQTISSLPEKRRVRYAREVLEIYAPIAARLGIGWLKGELEDCAFSHVYPEEYRALRAQIRGTISENKTHLETLQPRLKKLLDEEGITPLRIDARTKHLYSLWRKLKRYDDDLGKIYDLVALRIIVQNEQECYTVLGTLHKHWTPLPGRIKDYIALPKPNGYRSLHTTVFCDNGKITEFQIRTPEMHHEAEFGIAAHWMYKEDSSHPFKKHIGWIQQLQEWQKVMQSDELLESLKIDFFQDRIFVFTPEGDVIDLPKDATPVDFAYAIHTDIGERCSMAKVNGKAVQLNTPLKNSDIVEIVTAKNKKPSRDWLGFVKTSKARTKIRDALRREGVIM